MKPKEYDRLYYRNESDTQPPITPKELRKASKHRESFTWKKSISTKEKFYMTKIYFNQGDSTYRLKKIIILIKLY